MTDAQFAGFDFINAKHNGTTGDTIIMADPLLNATLNNTIINGGLKIKLAGDDSQTFTLAYSVMQGSGDFLILDASALTDSAGTFTFDGSAEDGISTGNYNKVNIVGTNYADSIIGTGNADGFFVSLGNDKIDGGNSDKDWINFSALEGQVTFDEVIVDLTINDGQSLEDSSANVTVKNTSTTIFFDTMTNVEDVFGSSQADHITGNTSDNWLDGSAGDDTITVASGSNTLVGGSGADSITGGSGTDIITGGAGTDTLIGGDGDDRFIYDSSVADATGIGESIDGGNGSADTLLVAGGTSAIDFSNDTIENIEILELKKNAALDAVDGYGQQLKMTDAQFVGFDKINAVHDGTTGDTIIMTTKLTDATLDSTVINGGLRINLAGSDAHTLTLSDSVMDASTDLLYIDGSALSSTLNFDGSLETTDASRLKIVGTASADILSGGGGADTLIGGAGADTLIGGAGADTLIGGAGADSLTGEGDSDTFEFTESTSADDNDSTLVDTVTDFVQGSGNDVIQFNESSLGFLTGPGTDFGKTISGTPIDPRDYKVVGITDTITDGIWGTDMTKVAAFINGAVDCNSTNANNDNTYFILTDSANTRIFFWEGDETEASNPVDGDELKLIATLAGLDGADIGNFEADNFEFIGGPS